MNDPRDPSNPLGDPRGDSPSAADRLVESVREAVTRSYEAARPRIEETKVRSGPQLEAGADRAAVLSERLGKRADAKAEEIEAGPQKEYTPVMVSALRAGAALAEAAADAAHWAAHKGRQWAGEPEQLPPGSTDGTLDELAEPAEPDTPDTPDSPRG